MAPGSIFHHIIFYFPSYKFPIYKSSFLFIYFCNLYFPIYTTKIPKIFILLSLSDLTFASDREGIDNPFIALVARFLIVCAGTRWLACYLLLDWYLGSQKLREILTLLCCITLSSSREKPTQRLRSSSIRYTFRGNNLKSTVSILLEKFQQLLLEVLNSLFLLSKRDMKFLLLGACISPLR